jgi:hypothetical protein
MPITPQARLLRPAGSDDGSAGGLMDGRMPGQKKPRHGPGFSGVARSERFELPTTWFVARYSIQLSYERVGPRIIGNLDHVSTTRTDISRRYRTAAITSLFNTGYSTTRLRRADAVVW